MRRGDPQIQRLLRELENPATREHAVTALAVFGAPVVQPLSRIVRHGEHNTSQTAARVLAQIGAPAVEALCDLLDDDDWNVGQSAASALARIGLPAVEPLCRKLGDPNPRTAHLTAAALAKIRKPAAEELCRALGNPDPGVGAHAADALVKMGSPAIPTLTRALREPGKYLKSGVVDTVERGAQIDRIRTMAAWALCRIGGSGITVLCSLLGSQDEAVHRFAIWALEQGGDAAVDALCRNLEIDPGQVQHVEQNLYRAPILAALTLGRLGKLGAVGPLVRALDAPTSHLRSAAALGLAELASTNRSPELRAQLPQLRRRQRWKVRGSDEWNALEKAIQSIETATRALAEVPLPTAAPPPDPDALPRPSGPTDPDSALLPIAAGSPAPGEPASQSSWWSRLTRRFQDIS